MSYDVTIFGIDLTLKPEAFTIPIGNGWTVNVIRHIFSYMEVENNGD